MKVIYDTDAGDDPITVRTALKAVEAFQAHWDICAHFRSLSKHGDPDDMFTAQEVYDYLWSVWNEYGIDPLGDP